MCEPKVVQDHRVNGPQGRCETRLDPSAKCPLVDHAIEYQGSNESPRHVSPWLFKRIGADVEPPRLSQISDELIGGRLLSGANGPAAQLVHHDQSGHSA